MQIDDVHQCLPLPAQALQCSVLARNTFLFSGFACLSLIPTHLREALLSLLASSCIVMQEL